jgi:hypothetical protein
MQAPSLLQGMLLNRIHLCVATAALSCSCIASAVEPLSIAQIEKVTGLSGLVAKPAKYDKVATAYVTASNASALTVKIASAAVYDVWKSQPPMDDQAPLSGLGDEAISSKKGRYVCFKKANAGVCVIGAYALPGKPAIVSDVHLLELARLASSNL